MIFRTLIFFGLSMIAMPGCRQENRASEQAPADPSHTSQNALDWWGTYHGVLPCADCDGIDISLTLSANLTYTLRTRQTGGQDAGIVKHGSFSWNASGNTVLLGDPTEGVPSNYLVQENTIVPLDREGKEIHGDASVQYRLTRTPASRLSGIRWDLDNLMGKHMRMNPAYLMFDADRGLVTGYAWCNPFQTTFELTGEDEISFGSMVVGSNICKDTTLEIQLINLFAAVTGFDQTAHTLSLYRVENAPLVVFRKAQIRGVPGQ